MRIGKVVETECNDGVSYSSPAITLCIVVEGYLVRLFIACLLYTSDAADEL